jgi:hypothetical protein
MAQLHICDKFFSKFASSVIFEISLHRYNCPLLGNETKVQAVNVIITGDTELKFWKS